MQTADGAIDDRTLTRSAIGFPPSPPARASPSAHGDHTNALSLSLSLSSSHSDTTAAPTSPRPLRRGPPAPSPRPSQLPRAALLRPLSPPSPRAPPRALSDWVGRLPMWSLADDPALRSPRDGEGAPRPPAEVWENQRFYGFAW